MICKNCGNEIKENEKFCSSCGTPVGEKNNLEDTITFGGVEIAKAIIEDENKEKIKEIVPEPIQEAPSLEENSNINFEEIKQEMEPLSQESLVDESNNSVESTIEVSENTEPSIEPISTDLNSIGLETQPIVEENVSATPLELDDNLVNTVTLDNKQLDEITPVMESPIVENISNVEPTQEIPNVEQQPIESMEANMNSVELETQSPVEEIENPVDMPVSEAPFIETPINTNIVEPVQGIETPNIEQPSIDIVPNDINMVDSQVEPINVTEASQEVSMPISEGMEQPQSTEVPFLNSADVVTDETGIISPVFPFSETPIEAPVNINTDPNFDRNVNNIPLDSNDSVIDNSTQQLNVTPEPIVNNGVNMNVNTIEPVSQLETNNADELKEEKPKKKSSKLFIVYIVTILILFIAFMVLFVFTDIGSNLISSFK